jgi:antagonist of KipI
VKTVLHVVEPGLLTTIQDLGRPAAISAGVPPGGAMDRFAHRAANLLVRNSPQDATLECTMSGPHLVAEEPCLIAITGGDFEPCVNGAPVPMWTALFLGRGDRLKFGPRRTGARAYIAIGGGFEGDRWLGSRSTSLMAGRGGRHGRTLATGDELVLSAERSAPAVAGRHLPHTVRPAYSDHVVHAMPGPHLRRLDAESRRLLFTSLFTVSRDADRMGYRLEGPGLATSGDELLSFGLVAGAVQVPRSGQPILLMADHQTAGGYPVAAVVISASMPIAAQLAPGDPVRFAQTTAAEANRRRLALSAALATLSAP